MKKTPSPSSKLLPTNAKCLEIRLSFEDPTTLLPEGGGEGKNRSATKFRKNTHQVCNFLNSFVQDCRHDSVAKALHWCLCRKHGLKVVDKRYEHYRLITSLLTIIPRARMGSEPIAHNAEGRMGYWLRGREGERNNCFNKIQLVGQKYRDKTTLA